MATVIEQEVPPLTAGDKLTRAEFLRRWELNSRIKRAELIGGIVYMPSPVSVDHGEMDGNVGAWLGVYKASTPGLAGGHDTTSYLLDDMPQPDQHLRILPEYGGSSWVENNYLHGPPELIVEICRSSVSYDLHVKLDLYQTAKVPEYLAILLYEKEIRWHILDGTVYQLLPAGADDCWRSSVFPGLWLDGKALLAGNMSQVLATLQEGLNSPDHQAFVAHLKTRKKT